MFDLLINPKWKKTPVYTALSSIILITNLSIKRCPIIDKLFFVYHVEMDKKRCLFEEGLDFLDFKLNTLGLCYLARTSDTIIDYRRLLAKCQNVKQHLNKKNNFFIFVYFLYVNT